MAVYTTIDNPELYFQVKLYTSDGSDDTVITYDGSEDMAPNLVWIKDRSSATSSYVCDSVRGSTNRLRSDATTVEATETTAVKSFGSDGFTLGTHGAVNSNTSQYATWNWKESSTAGFDIVGYTGNDSARTISHSLSAVPHMIINKNRTNDNGWNVYHHKNTSAPETDFLALHTNAATADATRWNDTAPTSSVFSVDGGIDVNSSSHTYITYLWSEKQGFSKFGSYTGNGNADGTFVYLGFKPAFMLTKRTDGADHWTLWDNKRESNPNNNVLYPSLADAESTSDSSYPADLVSNGVKWRGTSTGMNASGGTYIYMAFAEAPFVNSNGVPCNAR